MCALCLATLSQKLHASKVLDLKAVMNYGIQMFSVIDRCGSESNKHTGVDPEVFFSLSPFQQ